MHILVFAICYVLTAAAFFAIRSDHYPLQDADGKPTPVGVALASIFLAGVLGMGGSTLVWMFG